MVSHYFLLTFTFHILALKLLIWYLIFTGTSRALRYVTGYVLGHSFSGVQGYVWNHRFYGSIYVRKSVLFVEPIVSNNQIRFPYYVPSARRTVRKKGSLNAYVYKIYSRKMKRRKKNKKVRLSRKRKSILLKCLGLFLFQSFNVEPRTSPNHLFSGDKFFFTSRWKHTATYSNHHHPRPPPPRTKETSCKTCSLILVADYEFFRDVGEGSIKKGKQSSYKKEEFCRLYPIFLQTFSTDLNFRAKMYLQFLKRNILAL